MRTPIYTGLLQSDLDATGYRIIGLQTPSGSNDAATKAYVDAHAGGGGGGGLPEGWVSVMDFGAAADGVTDDTGASVAAIAAAGSVVYFPAGNYFFAGSIGVVPTNVALVGANQYGPSNVQYNTSTNPLDQGTTFMLTANAGNGAGTPFIDLSDNSSVTGITFYWPNQLPRATTPTAYPWAIHAGTGTGQAVRYCSFVNAYQCIHAEYSNAFLIEETRGQALYRGVKLEGQWGVTRLRGVYFDCNWDLGTAVSIPNAYQLANSIAFDIGRADLLILDNCFAFGYKTWVHFYDDFAHSSGGPHASWAMIRGGGGDQCAIAVWVEQSQDQGIDIDGVHLSSTSGYAAAPNRNFQIDASNTGSVRIHNSMVFTNTGAFGTVAGNGQVTVEDTYFLADITGAGVTQPSLATTGWAVTGTGNFRMNGCTFRTTQTHVSLGSSLNRAVITGNMCSDTFTVTNSMAAGAAVIDGNTGQGTVYVGSDMRLVAISGGAKIQVRNTGTGTWVDADQWTNP